MKSCRNRACAAAAVCGLLLLAAGGGPAAAHGFGARYDLPLPLSLYLGAAVAVVALTFALLALASRRTAPQAVGAAATAAPTARSARPLMPVVPGSRLAATLIRTVATALFLVMVAAALFGNQDPFKNLAPVSVWIIGWVGIAYVSALIGPVWRLLNPWDALYRLLARLWPRTRTPLLAYPSRLSGWPTVVLFWGFVWCELVWPARDVPAALGGMIVAYSLVTFAGMLLFGRAVWLERGEVFHVAFGLLARFAPIAVVEPGENEGRHGGSAAGINGRRAAGLTLRLPASGLLLDAPVAASLAAFALLMLSGVTFDGFLETPLWYTIAETATGWDWVTGIAAEIGVRPYTVVATVGLILFPLLFAGCYLIVAAAMAAMAGSGGGGGEAGVIARRFVLTLMPIAIGYHLAHYLSYLFTAGQFIIPIASDPFGWGWNLFGTKLYLLQLGIIDARAAWYGALIFIIGGHVIAVWLAHIEAERHFENHRQALASQWPMLILMLGYTAISLWILAQPITEAG